MGWMALSALASVGAIIALMVKTIVCRVPIIERRSRFAACRTRTTECTSSTAATVRSESRVSVFQMAGMNAEQARTRTMPPRRINSTVTSAYRIMRRRIRALIPLILILGVVAFWPKLNLISLRIIQAVGGDIEDTEWNIHQLSRSRRGVRMAAERVYLIGRDEVWTWSVLFGTPHTEYAVEVLNTVLADPTAEPSRHIGACYVLWELTGDTQYLRRLFNLVRFPGHYRIEIGRELFARVFTSPEYAELLDKIRVKHSQEIELSSSQFEEALALLDEAKK